jgi:hypothetical protein
MIEYQNCYRDKKNKKISTLTMEIEQSVHIQFRFSRDTVNPQRVIHERKVEENKEKEKKKEKKKHIYATASQNIHLIFYTFTLFYL